VTAREVRIRNALGLHARAAARFVHTASRFRSRVTVTRNGKAMDGKLLAASQGSLLHVSAEGEDEAAAVDALASLVDSGFGEEA